MRILLDPGTYNCQNLGDVAMLQVAVNRLARLLPDAMLQVITDTPDRMAQYCPNAEPVSASARRAWFEDDVLPGRGRRYVPAFLLSALAKLKQILRRRAPGLLKHALRVTRAVHVEPAEFDRFLEAVYSADCVIVCGQGFLTDHARRHALATLNLLATAKAEKIPYVMLGQGIGPLTDKAVVGLSRAVLPDVELLSLRERLSGVSLCQSLEAPSSRCFVTGDEAVELAYRQQTFADTSGLGINIRLSPSSGLTEKVLPSIAAVLSRFAQKRRHLHFVPLPIARDHHLRDVQSIRQLLRLAGCQSDGGVELETPEAIVTQASKCRVVLTGAYHAAVFALSQGIPAVCLAKSAYFRAKFEGLADQFGTGCVVISLDEPCHEDRLSEALDWAWETAPRLDEPLRRAANLQILRSYRVYNRLGRFLRRRFPAATVAALDYPTRSANLVPLA